MNHHELTNPRDMRPLQIPAGEFQMGAGRSAVDEAKTFMVSAPDLPNEYPQHPVRITKPFYLGVHAVTQGEWEQVMRTKPWSAEDCVQQCLDHTATHVSWEDAQEFCRRLSEHDGVEYRLPTEAEWERIRGRVSASVTTCRNWVSMLGIGTTHAIAGHAHTAWGRSDRTRGACITCTGTCGNGARTGTALITTVSVRRKTLRGLHRARTG